VDIVPVIDVLRGMVVRGVGGRRNEYRPIQSVLTWSAVPADVAAAYRQHFRASTLYLADLDAILDRRPHVALYSDLARAGFLLWVDAGVRSVNDAAAVLAAGVETAIVGLESCPSPAVLTELVQQFGPSPLMFSLDLRDGVPMLPSGWPPMNPSEIAKTALAVGFRRLLVLDLSDVGTSTGGRTDGLLQTIRDIAPEAQLVAGGGVRGVDDLERLSNLGVDAVLVASALHDGRLMPADLERFQRSGPP